MTKLLAGKLPPEILDALLREGPPLPPEVVLGPALGEDACAIALERGVLVAATDPITLTGEAVGAHAVVINANDVAVMGVRPRWFLATVLLPAGTGEQAVRDLFAGMRAALSDVGAALVGGHTEVTEAVNQPVVVGQMLGHSPDGRIVSTGGMRPGDAILQVGPAPVEGAAVLAEGFAQRLEAVAPGLAARAADAVRSPGISVVEAALIAADAGASALHDPTEGGLASGLHELALASGAGIALDESAVIWFETGTRVCEALGADPWGTLASGALLAALPGARAHAAVARLREAGHPVAVIGAATDARGVRFSTGDRLPAFARDETARLLESAAAG